MIAGQTNERTALPAADRHVSTDELFRTYARYVERLLVRMGVRSDALDDAVQEVFLTAHRNGGYAPGAAKPSTYLARIALHTALSERRRVRTRGARFAERAPDELEGAGCDPLRAIEAQESLGRVDRALARLNPTLRATLWLADAEGESCVSIAAATEVPVGTVYWRLDRARKQFRDALQRLDGKSAPRRALGLLFPWGLGDADFRSLLGRHAQALLERVRLTPPPSTSASFAALGGAKGMVVLGAVCMSVTGALVVATGPGVQRVPTASASFAPAAPVAIAPLIAAPVPTESDAREPTQPSEVAASIEATRAPARDRHAGRAARSRRTSAPSETRASASARTSEQTLAWLGAEADDVLADTPARIAPEPPPAPPAQPAQPAPSEAVQIAHAVRLLPQRPRAALAMVRALPARPEGSFLQEEREYVEVMALLALGQRSEGASRADAFLRAHPASALGRAIRQALQR